MSTKEFNLAALIKKYEDKNITFEKALDTLRTQRMIDIKENPSKNSRASLVNDGQKLLQQAVKCGDLTPEKFLEKFENLKTDAFPHLLVN